jgi:hypothetical protein
MELRSLLVTTGRQKICNSTALYKDNTRHNSNETFYNGKTLGIDSCSTSFKFGDWSLVNAQGVQRLPPMTIWFQQHMMFFNYWQREGCRKKIESALVEFYEVFRDSLLHRNSMIPTADELRKFVASDARCCVMGARTMICSAPPEAYSVTFVSARPPRRYHLLR